MGRGLAVCGLWVGVALASVGSATVLTPRVVMPVRSAPEVTAPVACMLWPGVDAVRWDGPGATWRVGAARSECPATIPPGRCLRSITL